MKDDKGQFVNHPKTKCAFLPPYFKAQYKKDARENKKRNVYESESSDEEEPLDTYIHQPVHIPNIVHNDDIDVNRPGIKKFPDIRKQFYF